MLTGWIDASGAAAAAMSTIDKETAAEPLVTLRRRHVHRLPGPTPDARAARRRQHATGVVDAGAEGRSRRSTVATCCCSAVPSPTWRGTASPPPSPTSPSSSTVIEDGRPRRLSVRRAAHPATAPVGDVAVGRGDRRAAVPHQLGRRPGRHGGGARARPRRARHPGRSASGRRCRTTSRRCRTRRRRSPSSRA